MSIFYSFFNHLRKAALSGLVNCLNVERNSSVRCLIYALFALTLSSDFK